MQRICYEAIGEQEPIAMHEELTEVCKTFVVKEMVQKVVGVDKEAWRKARKLSDSAKDEELEVFDRRSAQREVWNGDMNTQRTTNVRRLAVQVEASEASYVSFDRLDDLDDP